MSFIVSVRLTSPFESKEAASKPIPYLWKRRCIDITYWSLCMPSPDKAFNLVSCILDIAASYADDVIGDALPRDSIPRYTIACVLSTFAAKADSLSTLKKPLIRLDHSCLSKAILIVASAAFFIAINRANILVRKIICCAYSLFCALA